MIRTTNTTNTIAPLSAAELDKISHSVMSVVLSRVGMRLYLNADPIELNPSDLREIVKLTLAAVEYDPIAQARLAAQPVEANSQDFAAWLAREMPAGTVIGDPAWWAPKILRAALAAPVAAQADTTERNLLRIPTEAMLNAAREWSVKKYGIGIGNDAAVGCWQAMYDATSVGEADTTAPAAQAVDAARLLNRAAFVSDIVYQMYEAEVSDLHSALAHWRAEHVSSRAAPVAAAAPVSQAVEQPADDAEDAARYRAWRGAMVTEDEDFYIEVMARLPASKEPPKPEAVDAAIDAAMSATKQEGDK